jgi:ribose-phosphate pyrophosphokinase
VQCLKTRDTKTGALSGFSIADPLIVKGRNVVIIDDICDGGGTFIGLAQVLLEAGAQSLRLGVTHGLFTKGLAPLHAVFSQIHTLDTCKVQPENGGTMRTVSTDLLIQTGNYF